MEQKSVDIFTTLKTEHEELKSLLEFGETCPVDKRQAVLKKIELALVPHSRGEEKTLYAVLRQESIDEDDEDALDMANEAYEEHRAVDDLMSDIKLCSTKDETWVAKLKVIKENLQHHIKEEESRLFKMAKDLIPKDILEEIAVEYIRVKEKFAESLPSQSQIRERDISAGISPLA